MIPIPLRVFLAARLLLSLLGVALWLMHFVPPLPEPILTHGPAPPVEMQSLAGMLFGVWQRFDALHYVRIAGEGYAATQLSVYYPLFPMLMRLAAPLLGGNMLLAGLGISNLACLLMLFQLHQLLLADGFEPQVAGRALVYLTFSPQGFFLLVPYTEALFLLLAVSSLHWARRGQWCQAALAGFLAALARPQGVCLAPVMVCEAYRQRQGQCAHRLALFVFSLLPVLGWGLFMAWRAWLGFPPVLEVYAQVWGRFPSFPGWGMALALARMVSGQAGSMEFIDFAVLSVGLGLSVLAVRRLPATYSVYGWVLLFFNLSQYLAWAPLSGATRFATLLFPAFVLLAEVSRAPNRHLFILFVSGLGWAYCAAAFILGGFVG